MSTVQIITLAIAVYLGLMGSLLNTQNMKSAFVFKFLPLVGTIALVLISFGVIQ